MLFNSADFLLFAVAFFALWFVLRGQKQRLALLVVASLFFYAYWDWRFVFLLCGSGGVDFLAALGMAKYPRRKRSLLLASIVANVGSLVVFKYLGFLVESFLGLLGPAGSSTEVGLAVSFVLPVGISFYTFQSMSYTIDVYRGRLQPTHSLLHFIAYLAMFPQLVAGPIVRASHMLPQLEQRRTPTPEQRWTGWRFIAEGFFKKCVLADNLAPFVNSAFGRVGWHDAGGFWWLHAALFAFQIYYDFSAYSLIARGLGKLMGLEIPVNFNHPYHADSFRDFWRRWHISLSSWFGDYVYIPLGGNRKTAFRTHFNLWVTMLVSGLWHGAAWTFVAWGGLHAAYLSIERITGWPDRLRKALGSPGRFIAIGIVFVLTLLSWVLFRAETFGDALTVYSLMLSPAALLRSFDVPGLALLVLAVGAGWELVVFFKDRIDLAVDAWARVAQPLWPAALIVTAIYFRGPGSAFIYFQF